MILRARDLGFAFAGREVLRGVSLTADAGQIVGIVGPNGAGKSTLLRLLAGLLPHRGHVTYGDIDLAALRPRARARWRAFLPQALPADLPYQIGEIVALGLTHRHPLFFSTPTRQQVLQALACAGCARHPTTPYAILSGGERQQVMLARALVQDAPLLFLDEPTSNLDLHHRAKLAGSLKRRAAGGATIVVTLHDLSLAALLCDRLLLLQKGTALAFDAPARVLIPSVLNPVFGPQLACGLHPTRRTPTVEVDLSEEDLQGADQCPTRCLADDSLESDVEPAASS